MKIQCSCGAKYSLDAPDNVSVPVRFICPACGLDNSDTLNQLLQVKPGSMAASRAAVEKAIPLPAAKPTAIPTIRVHVASGGAPSPRASGADVVAPTGPRGVAEAMPCLKHPGNMADHRCFVCQKPICAKCMELFGHVCSVYCQEAADKNGLEIPVYEQQLSVVRARARRKAQRMVAATMVVLAAATGLWAWYLFFGSQPHVIYSVPFSAAIYQGDCKLIPPHDALLLRGGRLSRFDWSAKKEIWSTDLLDRKQIEIDAAKKRATDEDETGRPNQRTGDDELGRASNAADSRALLREMEQRAASSLQWQIHGKDIWIGQDQKLSRIDWSTGRPVQEIPLNGRIELFHSDESAILVVTRGELGRQSAIRIALPSGEVQKEVVPLHPVEKAARSTPRSSASEGVEVVREPEDQSRTDLIASGPGFTQLSIKLLESKTATVQAMNEPPKKSALEGTVNAAATTAIVNETLNESQREETGGVDIQDVSRYQVALHGLLDREAAEWSGEVIGPPQLFPLKNVNVLVARAKMLVFDKTNHQLWESQLAYPLAGGGGGGNQSGFDDDTEAFAPCVERGETLFVFDQGVLAAFDRASGTVRWRLPSVGISRLIFDAEEMLYVNTTDAEQERLRHTQQIDVERKTRPVILKVDPKSGRILWRAYNCGRAANVSGKYVYAVESAVGEDKAALRPGVIPAHLRIYRLDVRTGQVIWEYYEQREPLALDFFQNTIQVLFKKEMQVLKFVSF